MKHYIIGIDTGGTFTDAVLLEREGSTVIRTYKSPTTHHALSKGIITALTGVLGDTIPPQAIEHIAISTTLATNAIVEKKGARVVVFVIGYVKHFKLPVKAILYVNGGHTITGQEEQPLDTQYLISLLPRLRQETDAYAICSAMSFVNPTHELITERAISLLDPKPVFCSHRMSCRTGMQERAATAALHAKLLPLMQGFLTDIKSSLSPLHLQCPVSIISGDCRPCSAEKVERQTAITVSSGPACSAYFGAHQTADTAIIVDIGGTTTDITMVKNGMPLIQEDGCCIDGWSTHIKAVDMTTHGIGGDSLVKIDRHQTLLLESRRVTPLCQSQGIQDPSLWLGTENQAKYIIPVSPSEFSEQQDPHSPQEQILQILCTHGSCSVHELENLTEIPALVLEEQLAQLLQKERIVEYGFTPTDALHVSGAMNFGNTIPSHHAADVLGRILGITGMQFANLVLQKTIEKIEQGILNYLTHHYWQDALTGFLRTSPENPVLGVHFSLKVPLIGLGAAAPFFLPQIARRLDTTVHFPEHYEVGNALGAALILYHHANTASAQR